LGRTVILLPLRDLKENLGEEEVSLVLFVWKKFRGGYSLEAGHSPKSEFLI